MRTRKIDGGTATYNNSLEVKSIVFAKIIAWFIAHRVDSGISIIQGDYTNMNAPEILLAELLDDVIEFDISFDEE